MNNIISSIEVDVLFLFNVKVLINIFDKVVVSRTINKNTLTLNLYNPIDKFYFIS